MNSGKNILGILNYNENKVAEGKAICIHENLFGMDVRKLTFSEKYKGLDNCLQRNKRATTKAVHISLNFHPMDSLNVDLLCSIADTYMKGIGFGNQPYLVYQHFDAAHPHIHIVSTNIQKDGKRIILYNIGRNQSEKVRKEIEKQYNLVPASGRKQEQYEMLSPANVHKVVYGKSETKRSISNIVRYVTKTYKYSSVTELNAVLSQFNVIADRGNDRSQMYARNGLLYRLIDSDGKKVGIPIKASSIYGKPTLKYLEKQFNLNKALRAKFKAQLRTRIERFFTSFPHAGKRGMRSKGVKEIERFIKDMSAEGITVLFRQNEKGRFYGITFIDHKNKVVFNGSDLGKAYSAKNIMERFPKTEFDNSLGVNQHITTLTHHHNSQLSHKTSIESVIADLISAEQTDFTSPDAATKRKRKKKRKRSHI